MRVIQEFRKVSSDPHRYAREMKGQGRSCIGFFCSYTPEEIILAAGIHPVRLFGAKDDTSIADKHLQAYCCSLVRGALADVLAGRLDYLDGAVFPHTCDSIQRLSDIWRLNTAFRFFSDIVLPVKLTTESARHYFEDVLRKFRSDLETAFHVAITDDDMRGSIILYNTIRSSLKTIYSLHSQDPSLISGSDLNAVVKGAMILDRNVAAEMLQELTGQLKDSTGSDKGGYKRVMLVGSVCDQGEVYTLIERAGAQVVFDDLCTGSRYFEGTIDEQGDPIEALARRYFGRVICPAKHSSVTFRGDNLVLLAREHQVDGVIFLQLKFCDPHSFDYPYLKGFLDKEGIPNMLLEMEAQLPPEGQLLTRFETFVQML